MKQKSAFSLIEILLVTAIIAVVTAMGFSISKSGMEKAYNLYWYTGYSTLNDVTYDAIHKGKITLSAFKRKDYCEHLKRMIIIRKDQTVDCSSDEAIEINAANGIRYTLNKYEDGKNFMEINMQVPHAQKTGAKTNTNFILPLDNCLENTGNQILVYPAKKNTNSPAGYLDLQDRADLLPFYKKPNSSERGVKDFYGFKTAFCQMNGTTYGTGTEAEIDCGTGTTPDNGTLKHISPRKAY